MPKDIEIIEFNPNELEDISSRWYEYKSMRDYRYLFSSKEWLVSYLKTYKPEKNFFIFSESSGNYVVFSLLGDKVVFSGSPFNDYNGFDLVTDDQNFPLADVLDFFRKRGYKLQFEQLFEIKYIIFLRRLLGDQLQINEGIGLKIERPNSGYANGISKRIKRMYKKYLDLEFGRATREFLAQNNSLLTNLLKMRKIKLISRTRKEYNESFEDNFDNMILEICNQASLSKNYYIDYCKKDNTLLAAAFYFLHQDKVIGYICSHTLKHKQPSYGLILHYWSAITNESQGITLFDLSRGNEDYKYRFGAQEYKLFSILIDFKTPSEGTERSDQWYLQDFEAYWNSTSWRLTRPIRNLGLRLKGLPPEQRPEILSEQDAKYWIEAIRRSSCWEITGPLRVFRKLIFPRSDYRTNLELKNKLIFKNQKKWPENKPLISVIIPCYNYGVFLKGALDSVFSQTFQNFEVIVINDGSTDGETIHVLNKLNYSKTRVIHQNNQGLAQTRNNGARLSQGKYLCFFDPDDLMEPTYLEKALIVLEKNEKLGSSYCWVKCFGEADSKWITTDLDPRIMRNGNISPSHSVIRKKAWIKVKRKNKKGFLSKYTPIEDYAFWIDMVSCGYGGKVIPEILINYRIHDKSLSAVYRDSIEERFGDLKIDYNNFFLNDKYLDKISMKYKHIIKINNFMENLNREKDYVHYRKPLIIFLPWIDVGGIEKVLLQVLKELKENKFTIYLFTTERSNNVWHDKFYSVTPYIYHLYHFLDQEDFVEFILNFVKTRRIKVICGIHSAFFYDKAREIKKYFNNIRIIDILHNDSDLGYLNVSFKNDLLITKHIVISDRIKNSLIQRGVDPLKIETIYNGVDTEEKFNPGKYVFKNHLEKLVVVFMGRFSREKRPLDFVKIAEFFNNDDRVEFMMGGDGILRENIEEYIEINNINNVKLLGIVDPEKYFVCSDILILTSEIEGFPLAALEAMAMENAILTTDVGEIEKIVLNGENGYVTSEIGNIMFFVNKIKYYIENRNMLIKHKKRARLTVKDKYNSREMVAKYRDIFKNIVDGSD
jgi:glycosyltransferase involved in cell wall biosynthesis